CQQHDISPRTF
nr:immunoglobulin light chain junction region [Macaca mulatta]